VTGSVGIGEYEGKSGQREKRGRQTVKGRADGRTRTRMIDGRRKVVERASGK
jgi:hypothetical protein